MPDPDPAAGDTGSNDLSALRALLFQSIRDVRKGDLDTTKAAAVNDLAQTLVATARLEVDYLKANGGGESTFVDTAVGRKNLPQGLPGPGGATTTTPGNRNGINSITRHVLRDED